MKKTVYIIKNKMNSTNPEHNNQIYENAKESLEKQKEKYYNTLAEDGGYLYGCQQSLPSDGLIMLISYIDKGVVYSKKEDIEKGEIRTIYIGEALLCKEKDKEKCNIKYTMKKCITNKNVIVNLMDNLELDLGDDFAKKSYVMVSNMELLINQITDLLIENNVRRKERSYQNEYHTYVLAPYAQHNNQCKRHYNIVDESEIRSEFQRDRERIVNSKAFRRLVDKAQIFSAKKGDHYRTRMTHTLEVNQIAKSISAALSLNLDLTEAIALAHDLGHTPFGHQGERTLRDILSDFEIENNFNIRNIEGHKDILGGFKHNFQSVRVLTKLEEKYIEYEGLDVSIQVLEGILKHSKLKDAVITEFVDKEIFDLLNYNQKFASSLEGQVVAIADEIAQRGHDIDDAISSGFITSDELLDSLSIVKFSEINKLLLKEKNIIDENKRIYINEQELMIGRITSCIVGYLIDDVICNSRKNIEQYKEDYTLGKFYEKLIDFSKDKGSIVCEFLEKLINKKVINNSEVARFDYNASAIIQKLFFSYYQNPKLLNKGTLRRIYVDTLMHNNELVSGSAIDLRNGNLDIVNNEIKEIKDESIDYAYINTDTNMLIRFEKRKVFIKNIVDYIAGMTDSYALCEYDRIK